MHDKISNVVWTDPQTGKKWYRVGECTHCGACCVTTCPYLVIVALRDIKNGERFKGVGKYSNNIMFLCEVYDKDVTVDTGCVRGCSLSVRQSFPDSPLSTPECCGYYWIDEEGNKWQRPDYSKGVLK